MEKKKHHALPTLNKKNVQSFRKDKFQIEQLLKPNRSRKTFDYRANQQIESIKATNFLSRMHTIDEPNVIFAVTEHIKEKVISKLESQDKKICGSLYHSRQEKQNNKHANYEQRQGFFQKTSNAFHPKTKVIAEERTQMLNLAKWIDEKLEGFQNSAAVSVRDILDYKQNILNFGLGKIINSVSKKCKEEGKLLELIWNSTFTIFQSIFNVLATATVDQQKQKCLEAAQSQKLFETNHHFLQQENEEIKQQNSQLFKKMKKVILWNRRLRKDREKQNTLNRILQYRNATYSASLQQTVALLLENSQEAHVIQMAKNIVSKLARQKRTKKKQPEKRQVQEDVSMEARLFVIKWLERNSFVDEEGKKIILDSKNSNKLTQDERILIQELEDKTNMNKVNIYDFFNLIDIGVQATVKISHFSTQNEAIVTNTIETMTKKMYIHQRSTQTVYISASEEAQRQLNQIKNSPQKEEKQSSQRHPSIFSKATNQNQKVNRGYSRTMDRNIAQPNKKIVKKMNTILLSDKEISINFKDLKSQSSNKKVENIKETKINTKESKDEEKFNEIKQIVEEKCEFSFTSLEDQQMQQSKNVLTSKKHYNGNKTNKSLFDLGEQKSNKKMPSISKQIKKKNQKNSVAFIKIDVINRSPEKFEHKKFNEAYQAQKQLMNKNKDQFESHITRRRSFYSKQKVYFENANQVEERNQRMKTIFRGETTLQYHRQKNFENLHLLSKNISDLTKKIGNTTNIAKTKAFLTSKSVFSSIASSMEQVVRIPPKNKTFVNTSTISIIKYINALIFDYVKQMRKERDEIFIDLDKTCFPLNILVMERMTFKYGLKDIAQKKIKDFIQKILTFTTISEKIELYSLLLGLEGENVGADELLIYIKCLVYFETKKAFKELSLQRIFVDIETVRQNSKKVLESFFDPETISILELKMQIYLQENSSQVTVQGISIMLIKEHLKRKSVLREKYSKVYQICNSGDNFFINLYKLLRMILNYREIAISSREGTQVMTENKESINILKEKLKGRAKKIVKNELSVLKQLNIEKISKILKEIIKRSDIMDEIYGKSISEERFIAASILLELPGIEEVDIVLNYLQRKLQKHSSQPKNLSNHCQELEDHYIEKLSKRYGNGEIVKVENVLERRWETSKLFTAKIEEESLNLLGKIGGIGLSIEISLLNLIAT